MASFIQADRQVAQTMTFLINVDREVAQTMTFFIHGDREVAQTMTFFSSMAKKIYRLKEDQAFSLSLELGRREKVLRHPSADFLLHSIGGGGDFVDTVIAVKILKKGMRDNFVKTLY